MPAPDRPEAPRPSPKRKPKRPWLILSKSLRPLFWYKDPKKRIPQWEVYRRYATEKSRDQAWQNLQRNPWAMKWAEYRLEKE